MTSAQNGVLFDIRGDGLPVKLAWTDETSGNAFLALDRNGNGVIDDGKELFGNFTDQPDSFDRSGFAALAVFDLPANGGNGDGVINESDSVWSRLRLWIDKNHDGISQSEELQRLENYQVHSLSLRYRELRRFDQYGNLFRYKAEVNPDQKGHQSEENPGRNAYDVFLVSVN